MKHLHPLLAILPIVLVAACASDASRTEAGQSRAAGTSAGPRAATASAAAGQGSVTDAIAARVVYFDFDSDDLRTEALPVIEQWAAYLVGNPGARVRLAGHADERGTREYNVGLGERRGNAVERALTARGASGAQIDVVSFGEERPAESGHGEGAWSRNRRVELTD